MQKTILLLLAFVCCVGYGIGAQASILNQLQPGLSALEDTDYEVAIDVNLNGKVDADDFLLAIATFDTFSNALTGTPYANFSPATNMVSAVSFAKVGSAVDLTGGAAIVWAYNLVAPSVADWAGLNAIVAGPLNFDFSTIAPGTVLAIFEDDTTAPSHLDNSSVSAGVTSASQNPGTVLGQFGFTGDASEFFYARTVGFPGNVITSVNSLTTYASLNPTDAAGMALPLSPHNFLGSAASGVPLSDKALFTGPDKLQLQGALGSLSPGGFVLNTDTDAYVNVVPEPISVLAWLGIGAAVALGRRFGVIGFASC